MHRSGATVAGACAGRLGVRLDIAENVHRKPEPVGGDPRERRLVTLTVGFGPGRDLDLSVFGKSDLHLFLRGSARAFQKTCDPEPPELAIAF